MLDQKNFGGNVAIEIDISKYFYTLDWSFLIELWFSHFCSWIFTIIHSGKLSFVMNGKNVGVLNCKRGVLNCMTLCYDFLSRKYKKFGSYYVFAQSSWRYLWSSTLVLTNGNSSLVYDFPKEAQYLTAILGVLKVIFLLLTSVDLRKTRLSRIQLLSTRRTYI